MIERADEKARGAFFTPRDVAEFLAGWAVRSGSDRVLEPSAGDGAIAVAVLERMDQLASSGDRTPSLTCVELDHGTAAQLSSRLEAHAPIPAQVLTGDFFQVAPSGEFDAAVGNPPFVRYQDFQGASRAAARRAALAEGVHLNALASSWAAFVVATAGLVKPAGRLALVLPAEMLTVGYAAPVRRFLLERFGRVAVVLFEERIFRQVQTEAVLLLAEGSGGTDHLHVVQLADASELRHVEPDTWRATLSPEDGRWLSGLLTEDVEETYREVTNRDAFVRLSDWGSPQLGAVTGANKFFALTADERAAVGIPDSDVVDISPPGSRHLRRLSLSRSRWEQLGAVGAAVQLLKPGRSPAKATSAYIREGEKQGLNERYKCRVRKPWWDVPLSPVPHLFVTYMNAGSPQVVANRARVHHLNSVHGIVLPAGKRAAGMDLLPLASVSTVSRLGAELEGRSYGGGVLKVEPTEAASLPTIAPDLPVGTLKSLRTARRRVATALARGDLDSATREIDAAMVDAGLLTGKELDLLTAGLRLLRGRRRTRSGS